MKDKQEKQNEVFIKLSVLAIKEGNVLAQISPDCWHVLTAIASFMDEEGNCCPTYDQLAKLTGVSKNAVMGRVKKLLNIRLMDGSPVITREKRRSKKGFEFSYYNILPNSGFSIFSGKTFDDVYSNGIPYTLSKSTCTGHITELPQDKNVHSSHDQYKPTCTDQSKSACTGLSKSTCTVPSKSTCTKQEPYNNNQYNKNHNNKNITFGNAATPPPSKKGKNLYPIVNNKGNIDKDIVMDNNGNMNCTNSRYIDVNNVKDNSNNTVDCNNLNNKDNINVKDDNTNQSSQSKVVAEIGNNLKERAKGSARATTKTEPEEKEKDRFKDWGINKPVTFEELPEVYVKRHPEELKEIKKYVDNILANVENGQGLFIYGEETSPEYPERDFKYLCMTVILTEYVKAKGEEQSDGTPPVLMISPIHETKNETFYQNYEQWKTVPLLALTQATTIPSYREDFNKMIEYRQNNNLPIIYSSIHPINHYFKISSTDSEKLDLIKVNKIVES
ncbi:helix-turn-helix domain-containing protein [Desulfolucanica intricata]|uniref:helix-turn-helix domain-containing protein n=1 Tax=Desulfolucanica intricata TaxID=1285191 RepID=UPI00082E184B|nr:helix-turn-helix domain-containing protein [Desulfolucanica intricata]